MFLGLFQWLINAQPLPRNAVITGIKWSRGDQQGYTKLEKLPDHEVEASIRVMRAQGWSFDGFTYVLDRTPLPVHDGYSRKAAYLKA
jgi:hypothetical protein